MARFVLPKKQSRSFNPDLAIKVYDNIERFVSRAEIDQLIDETAREVLERTKGKKVAYGWSGGKDAVALQVVMERCGIKSCVLAMTNLEYPQFLRYVTANMPDGLTVHNTGWDLEWLAKHQDWIFPRDSQTAGRWFAGIQYAGQTKYFHDEGLDLLMVGCRRNDGNVIGDKGDGTKIYTNALGVTRYSPIADWRHEHVFAAMHYYDRPEPPYFRWPNGLVQGTLCWPARQFNGARYAKGKLPATIRQGWVETYAIDRSVVKDAARLIPSAAEFLSSLGVK